MEKKDSDIENSSKDHCCSVQLHDVYIVWVLHLDRYSGCMKCTAKVVSEDDDAEYGHCMKCNAAMQEFSPQLNGLRWW